MEQRIDHRRIVIWVSIGLVIFLIPGLVRHMHRYQQMEAMLKSQERANQWVQSGAKGYAKTINTQNTEQLAALTPKLDAVVESEPAPTQAVVASNPSVDGIGVERRAAEPLMPQPQDRLNMPQESKPVGPKVIRPDMPQRESGSVMRPKIMQQANLAPKALPKASTEPKTIAPKQPVDVSATMAEAKQLEQGLAKRVFIPKLEKPVQVVEKKPGIVMKNPLMTLQVGVFSNKKSIDRLVSEMHRWGYDAYTESLANDKNLQRVLVQVDGKTAANNLKDKLWQKEKVQASIVR